MTSRRGCLLIGVVVVISLAVALALSLGRDPAPQGAPTAAPRGEEWIDLLDAEHALLWKNVTDDKDIFEIRDSELHIFGRTIWPLRYVGYTGEQFNDFELHLEYKLARRANSGVFIRQQPGDNQLRGLEIQILDDHGKAPTKNRSGAIYDVASPMFNMSRPAGEWNSYDITMKGQIITVIMNGWKVLEADLGKMTEPVGKFDFPFASLPLGGRLALQDHGGELWFRNIVIRKLAPAAASESPAPESSR